MAVVRLDYKNEAFSKISVCGIQCEFSDVRIDRNTVPEGENTSIRLPETMTAAVSRQGSS